MITPFPLSWPAGWQREKYPKTSRFDTKFVNARDGLAYELEQLGAKSPILSTNLELRLDGFPRANLPEPRDWRQVLGTDSTSLPEIEALYRPKARTAHPDSGGSTDAMAALNRAIMEARQELQ